ncbi:hypothetical protein [Actinophytocola sp. KF-1]
MTSSPRPPTSSARPFTQPLTHRLSLADSLVIVGALGFTGFLCVRDIAPHFAVVIAVTAVAALALAVVVPRGVVEAVGLLRELVQIRGEHLDRRTKADDLDATPSGDPE